MPLVVAFAALLLVAGCGSDDATVGAAGEVRVEQSIIEFPPTWIGYPTEEKLIVINTGRTTLRITLAIEGPFMMQSGTATLLGGENPLAVRFVPRTAGEHTGRVWVRHGEKEFEIPLVGTAAFPPTCRPSAPCREISFDPASGECIETVAEDGRSCQSGNLCLVDEICMEGRCIGSARNCDDGNICTEDGCDPSRGCVNVDITATLCGTPTNPCRMAVCDAVLGCGEKAVPDGTFCGEANCRVAHMCIDGTCGEYDVPDGTPCLDACGDGECWNKECVREEGDELVSGWRYDPDPGADIFFTGLEDAAGQIYLIETDSRGSFLVSLTQDKGYRRYRSPIAVEGQIHERGIAMEGGQIWIVGDREPAVATHLTSDGSSPWVVDLYDRARSALTEADCPCATTGGSLTRVEEGRILFAAPANSVSASDPHTYLAYIHGASGDVLWEDVVGGAIVGAPIADEGGNFYFLVETMASPWLVAMAADGSERWRIPSRIDALPLAVWDGVLHEAPATLRETETGAALGPLGYEGGNLVTPLHGTAGSFAFHADAANGGARAQSWDPDGVAGTPVQILRGPGLLSGPILTGRETALVGTSFSGESGWENFIHEIETDGSVRRVCSLGVDGPVFGAVALRSGRWAVQAEDEEGLALRTFTLPNGNRAARGWLQPLGNPGGGGRPQ